MPLVFTITPWPRKSPLPTGGFITFYFTWPTQSIPDTDTIDSATASFFHTTDSLVDADNSNIYLVANNQFSATALQADDFVDLGAINLATAALDITGMTNAYQDMAIASGNLGQINKLPLQN